LKIADWRLQIHGLPIGDCRFGLATADLDCRLPIRLAIGESLKSRLNIDDRGAVPIVNPQSSILNRQSSIVNSTIGNRQSVNRQSAIGNP
jgi:hypothetical protein